MIRNQIFLTTAELWKQGAAIRIVNLWATDAESEQNTLFCFDSEGKLKFMNSTNWSLPYENGKFSYWWSYTQRLKFNPDGSLLHRNGRFVNQQGQTVEAPELDKEEKKYFDYVPDDRKLADFGFPVNMLH